MDKKAIETLSVNAVRDSIVQCALLDQFIPDNDKEPSWDGHVYAYKNSIMLKEILASLEGLTDLERAEVLRTLMSGQPVLQKVKILLGITTEDQDDVLEYVIQTVQALVLRYINWDELPLELENVLAVMCVSYYKAAGLGTTAAAPGAVSSVKRGDVQTSFAVGSGSSGSAGTFNLGNDNGDFFGWKTVLNEYRKLRW